jgi:hypothetical protein
VVVDVERAARLGRNLELRACPSVCDADDELVDAVALPQMSVTSTPLLARFASSVRVVVECLAIDLLLARSCWQEGRAERDPSHPSDALVRPPGSR